MRGLMSLGPNIPALYRRSATYVDKILKGAHPADLPVEQPMKFELVINLTTAEVIKDGGSTPVMWRLSTAKASCTSATGSRI